jgi:hypothetical protein
MNIKQKKENEKLSEIPESKQAVHRDRGRGAQRCAGVCDNFYLLRKATGWCKLILS